MCLPRRAHEISTENHGSRVDQASSRRRQFSAEYKLRILREAEACEKPGEVGDLLRREGLYFSHLTNWRSAREKGEIAGLEPRKRGRKPKHGDPRDRLIGELRRENSRLRSRAERAEKLIEMQKRTRLLVSEPARGEQRELLVELVREAAKDVGVRTACDVFGVSRASFYRWADNYEETNESSLVREVSVHAPVLNRNGHVDRSPGGIPNGTGSSVTGRDDSRAGAPSRRSEQPTDADGASDETMIRSPWRDGPR